MNDGGREAFQIHEGGETGPVVSAILGVPDAELDYFHESRPE